MKKQLEIINTTFEKITQKPERDNFWGFITQIFNTFFALLFIIFFILLFHPIGWLSIVILSLLYKFVITS